MEISFQTNTIRYLKRGTEQTIHQEETVETAVPDSMPDVSRVIDCFGTILIRNKEVSTGTLSLSGGIHAGVLYVPEGEGNLQKLEFYIPFTVRAENNELESDSRVQVRCVLRGMDCRMANSRKLITRANLLCRLERFHSQEEMVCTSSGKEQLEVKTQTYTLVLPMEYQERAFSLSEQIELPERQATMISIEKYCVNPEITEAKLVGNKAVFKGQLRTNLVYTDDNQELQVWQCQMPFSQYVEMEREYESEEVQILPLLTGLEVQPDPEGRGILISVGLLSQCLVTGRQQLTVLEDAYSIREEFLPRWSSYTSNSRIDLNTDRLTMREKLPVQAKRVLFATVLPDAPRVELSEGLCRFQAPMRCSVVYEDSEGCLQQGNLHSKLQWELAMADSCSCSAWAQLDGDVFAAPSDDGIEVRCALRTETEIYTGEGIRGISGGELLPRDSTAEQPAVVIRSMRPEENFWKIAKSYHTTVEAILQANSLDREERTTEMLLIPMG